MQSRQLRSRARWRVDQRLDSMAWHEGRVEFAALLVRVLADFEAEPAQRHAAARRERELFAPRQYAKSDAQAGGARSIDDLLRKISVGVSDGNRRISHQVLQSPLAAADLLLDFARGAIGEDSVIAGVVADMNPSAPREVLEFVRRERPVPIALRP